MVNEDGVIREDAFYNYMTGWYNVDNMMYYVSQVSLVNNNTTYAHRLWVG